MPTDIISDIGFFCLVVKQGSLTAAAHELGQTPPTASKRLAAIERRLGVRLLHRTTRRTTMTREGEAYLEGGKHILDLVADLEHSVASAQAEPTGLLRINAPQSFGRRHIAPAVSAFLQKYPDLEAQVQLTDRPAKLIEDGFDVGIRIGGEPDARMAALRIASNQCVLCASPLYIKRFGNPATPADLHQHRCIVLRGSDPANGVWPFQSGSQREHVKVHGAVSCNDGETNVGWALDGQGILKHYEWEVAPYLRSGRLVRLLPEWSLPPADIYAVYVKDPPPLAKVNAFLEFLARRFERHRSSERGRGNW